MDFIFTREQQELKNSAIAFAERMKSPDILELDKNGRFSTELWAEYAKYGALGMIAPKEYGGLALDFISCIAVMEGLGYGSNDNGILFSINAHIWSCVDPLLNFGTEYQKETYLPGLCDGSLIGVHAMTEPEAGSDAFNIKTTARRVNDHYILNGSKTFITNGNIADLLLVFVKTKNRNGLEELSCLLVPAESPGFSRSRTIEKMGLRTSPFCQLYFDDCTVPASNILGREGSGKQVFTHAMDGERAFIMASQIGAMEKQLDNCVKYAHLRRQFDKPIFQFQSISNMLADMKVRLETSRLLLHKVAWLKTNGRNVTQDSAIAKLHISESCVQNSLAAMRIHGGAGYTTEIELERQMRDALGGLFYSGTSEMMRNIIAELLD